MRLFFRVLAGFTLIMALATLRFVVNLWRGGALAAFLESGAFGLLTAAGWVATLVAGLPAVVLLWRRTDAGRLAGIIVYGSICIYYLLCLAFFRSSMMLYGPMFLRIIGSGILVILLLSPQARKACAARRL